MNSVSLIITANSAIGNHGALRTHYIGNIALSALPVSPVCALDYMRSISRLLSGMNAAAELKVPSPGSELPPAAHRDLTTYAELLLHPTALAFPEPAVRFCRACVERNMESPFIYRA